MNTNSFLGVCGAICGKKQDVKGRVEPVKEKEVYKETQKEVIIPRFHEESIKGKRYRYHRGRCQCVTNQI